jgi:hypothetical protein
MSKDNRNQEMDQTLKKIVDYISQEDRITVVRPAS